MYFAHLCTNSKKFRKTPALWQSFANSRYNQTQPMPTRNVNLTKELDRFVRDKVACGRYENASEVRAALRVLEREERVQLTALRTAIDAGDASGVAEGDPFERVRRTLKRPARSR